MGLTDFSFFDIAQGEEPPDTGGGRVFSFDASFGLLANVSASAQTLFFRLCAQLLWCELHDMKDEPKKQKNN